MMINIIGDELWGRIIYLNNLLLYYELQSHYVYSRAMNRYNYYTASQLTIK